MANLASKLAGAVGLPGKACATESINDAEPLMDPETRAIRRSAVRARHRRAHGREIDDPGVY